MITAGIDAGSRAIKMVLLHGASGEVVASGIEKQGVQSNEITMTLFARLLEESHLSKDDVVAAVATGYARNSIEIADSTVTEITCHATGVHSLVPEARTVIEIGGQDSKLLRLDFQGMVQDFAMNDRCAAGTGRFLEVVSERVGIELQRLGSMAAASSSPATISSMCIVFAETEIIGLLAAGTAPADIVAGVQNSIATRVASMIGRSVTPPVVFTGGVALIPGMESALARAIGQEVTTVPDPQYTGALGAAILAGRNRSNPRDA